MIGLSPHPDETQAEFCDRCHRELAESIPETDRRNAVCLQLCRDAGFENKLDRIARERFSDRDFVRVENVPYFTEHTTRDKDGNLVVYDRAALEAICDRCNHRILDTGNFAPITEGHTPTRDEKSRGAKDPSVLGYAGPYRLGMVGNVDPRWAIFTDEYQHREDVPKLRKMLRRSPEVWLEDKMEDRFFDPIAALGAETPRLDMGMARYGRHHDGREVEKYTFTAPAAASVFVPGGERDSYQSEDAKGIAMLSPDDINQIVEAMMQTGPMQWVQEQMSAAESSGLDAGMPDAGGMPGPDAGGMPPAAPPAVPAPPAAPGLEGPPPSGEPDMGEPEAEEAYEPDDEDRENFSRYMAGDMSDEEMSQYAARKRKKKNHFYAADCGEDPDMPTESYSRQRDRIEKARYEKLQSEVAELKAANAAAEAKARQAERYSKLSELHQEGFQFDPQEELADTANLNDEQFEKHLDRIASKYSRVPLEGVVPRIFAPNIDKLPSREDQAKKEHYAKEAQNRVLRARERGEKLDYAAALEAVKKESA